MLKSDCFSIVPSFCVSLLKVKHGTLQRPGINYSQPFSPIFSGYMVLQHILCNQVSIACAGLSGYFPEYCSGFASDKLLYVKQVLFHISNFMESKKSFN